MIILTVRVGLIITSREGEVALCNSTTRTRPTISCTLKTSTVNTVTGAQSNDNAAAKECCNRTWKHGNQETRTYKFSPHDALNSAILQRKKLDSVVCTAEALGQTKCVKYVTCESPFCISIWH